MEFLLFFAQDGIVSQYRNRRRVSQRIFLGIIISIRLSGRIVSRISSPRFFGKQWLVDALGILHLFFVNRSDRVLFFFPHLDQADTGRKNIERKRNDYRQSHSQKGNVQERLALR